ncbi:hypothetical protein RMATCC62417_18631 [Rhizopus microsporus]|nr:hypothetical protein RMATCC62417_18631 [Rhizopus microsporus]
MLADAHALNMFLVEIDAKTIFVDIDGNLGFFGFRYSFQKGKSAEKALWINWSDVRCLENVYLNQKSYSEKTDVFLVCYIMFYFIQSFEKRQFPWWYDRSKSMLVLRRSTISKKHSQLLNILLIGLKYDLDQCPKANEILKLLETTRDQLIMSGIDKQ